MTGKVTRRAARRDANEPEIIEALEAAGATVLQADTVDIICGYKNVNLLLEVKAPGGKLRPSQKFLQATWRGQYAVVRTVDDALGLLEAIDDDIRTR